jgi:hypothetical protein
MNQAVYLFKKYEDASLSYTGVVKHNELIIGGFNTKISVEELPSVL